MVICTQHCYKRLFFRYTVFLCKIQIFLSAFNQMQPSGLILNPKGLLTALNQHNQSRNSLGDRNVGTEEGNHGISDTKECWICYDPDKKGTFIEPCNCKGDVSSVHHECLIRWLTQNVTKNAISRCPICKCQYNVIHKGNKVKWKYGFAGYKWGRSALVATCMCVTVAGCWTVVHYYNNSYVQIVCAMISFFVVYIGFRFLGRDILHAYQRGKAATLNIDNRIIDDNKIIS